MSDYNNDREICRRVYDAASDWVMANPGDDRFAVLAYRWPVTSLGVLYKLIGLDPDLQETISACGRAGFKSTEDHDAFKNVLAAALDEAKRRADAGGATPHSDGPYR